MKLPPSAHNPLSYAGAFIALLAVMCQAFLLLLHTAFGGHEAPYAGMLFFIVFPIALGAGLVLIPLGMYREWRHIKVTGLPSIPTYPVVDFNRSGHRNAFFIFSFGTIAVIFVSAFTSYAAYHYSESVEFCGTTCHSVMQPEHTAYQGSPHARVRCVDCHVGPGASFFVKSKMDGLYQVYATLLNKYPRPIAAPISNLRPARETCEQCHWPEHFFESQTRRQVHFLPNEENTRWELVLLIKTGVGSPLIPGTGGIHWHMNLENKMEYFAADEKRQEIPWVRTTDRKTGEVREFYVGEAPPTKEEIEKADVRTVDCMDCHNRPTHKYNPPRTSVNRAMAAGKIDASLPYIKKTGVELLAEEYASTDEALAAIAAGVEQFYQEEYPDVLAQRRDAVDTAVAALQEIYRKNFFPEMKVRWDAYPDHIGHATFIGCFRCHDGEHKTESGDVISDDCRACHTILAQGKPGEMEVATTLEGLDFEHPGEPEDDWEGSLCTDCHEGAVP